MVKVSGIQYKILQFLYSQTHKGNYIPIFANNLSNQLSISSYSVRTSIYRLKQKGLCNVTGFDGRGGYRLLNLTELGNNVIEGKIQSSGYIQKNLKETTKNRCNRSKKTKTIDQSPLSNIYFLATETRTKVKIGISDNVDKRIRTIQTSNAEKLFILRIITGVPRELEAEIHKEFQHLKCSANNEWFNLTPELHSYITYMRIPDCIMERLYH